MLRTRPRGQRVVGAKTGRADPLEGLTDADDAGRNQLEGAVRCDPSPGEREAELGVVGDDAHVHWRRPRETDADGRPVDGTDHRLARVEDSQHRNAATVTRRTRRRPVVGGPGPFVEVEGVSATAEVGPGAERTARPGDDDHPYGVVGVGAVEGSADLAEHRAREGVEVIGPVERDDRGRPLDLVRQLGVIVGVGHAGHGKERTLAATHRAGAEPQLAGSASTYHGPEPVVAATSSGLYNRHADSDRQPHPMHPASRSRSR